MAVAERSAGNFLTQEKIKEKENNFEPTHLMFNMATGTGKTMLMAVLILYYYKKGYKQFCFAIDIFCVFCYVVFNNKIIINNPIRYDKLSNGVNPIRYNELSNGVNPIRYNELSNRVNLTLGFFV